MEWMFMVTACNRARVESRIFQVLDHHMIVAESFASMRVGDDLRVSFMAELDRPTAIRTRDLLRKLQDVRYVDSFANQDGLCRTLALIKVLCDQESRLPLLQVISSLGAQVVSIRPDWVAFQIIGTLQDIEGLRQSLLPYGLVDAISVASAVMRKESSAEPIEELPVTLTVVREIQRKPRREQAVAAL